MAGIKSSLKKWLLAGMVLLLAGVMVVWYIFTEKFDDTKAIKSDYSVQAIEFLKEYSQDLKKANEKYSEKIVVVNGIVSAVEMADTTANIKIMDSLSGSYIIFAFQDKHVAEAKALKPGDRIAIKGSCSDGVHSDILDVNYIPFKRCALDK